MSERHQQGPKIQTVDERLLARVPMYSDSYIIISDDLDRIIWVNNSFLEQTGYALSEIRGRQPAEVFRGKGTDPHDAEAVDAAFKRGERYQGEILNYTRNGEPFWIHLTVNPVFDEQQQVCNYVSIAKNITARKKHEKEIKKAKEHAEKVSAEKSRIFSALSHDIRTPLASLRGSLDLLVDEVEDTEQHELLDVMQQASDNMLRLLDDMLELSRIEAGRFSIVKKEIDLQKIVRNVARTFRPQASEKKVSLKVVYDERLPERLMGDQARINQVLANLVSNAVKFTDQGAVRMIVRMQGGTDKLVTVQLEIHDTGIGIPQVLQDKIFESFNQGSEEITRTYGGTGIGLAIARYIVEHMDGEIWLDSEPGQGTSFFVRLPLDKVTEESESSG